MPRRVKVSRGTEEETEGPAGVPVHSLTERPDLAQGICTQEALHGSQVLQSGGVIPKLPH